MPPVKRYTMSIIVVIALNVRTVVPGVEFYIFWLRVSVGKVKKMDQNLSQVLVMEILIC